MKIIAAGLLDDYLEHGALVIDLRSEEEYRRLHVDGAVNIPENIIRRQIPSLPHSRILVLYCSHGITSVSIGRILSHAGYRVVSVNGGISAYHGKYLVIG